MMKMHDVFPKFPMTYRDSPVTYTVVMMVVVDVDYLFGQEGVFKYCNFGRYSIVFLLYSPLEMLFLHLEMSLM